jgi:hypothetical protein
VFVVDLVVSQPQIGRVFNNRYSSSQINIHEIRSAAAWINNVLMFVGGNEIHISVYPAEVINQLKKELVGYYQQINDILKDYYGIEPKLLFDPLTNPTNNQNNIGTQTLTRIPRLNISGGGIFAGVNIGQTMEK